MRAHVSAHARLLLILTLLALSTAPAGAQTPLNDRQRILHFLNRAAFGPRPDDVERVEKIGLFLYIQQQLNPETLPDPKVQTRLRQYHSLSMPTVELEEKYQDPGQLKKKRDSHEAMPADTTDTNALLHELQEQRIMRAVNSERQLQEVMVDFWLNHFNIFFNKDRDRWLIASYERDAIRRHAFGKFRDLLGAVAHSPAMMFYLDNWASRKPYLQGKDKKLKGGLNENYARELLELHTLGVDGGYTQQDVVEVARCFTGWSIDKPTEGNAFLFRADFHDNDPKTVLGHTLPAGGGQQDGERVLDLLARHPSTARFLARKLCREFVADDPPPALVDRVARTYLRTDGDIRLMLGTLFNSPEFWSPSAYQAKVKTPLYLVISALRALGADLENGESVERELATMGMGLYLCDPPTGYPDRAEKWLSPGSLLERMSFGVALSKNRLAGVKVAMERLLSATKHDDSRPDRLVEHLADNVLHGDLSPATRAQLLQQLPDYGAVVGMLLGSPEFQRR